MGMKYEELELEELSTWAKLKWLKITVSDIPELAYVYN
jgi:hypothetical protein